MEYILSPSILAADFKVLGEQIRRTEENGAKYLHFDVMDGRFVPSISFGIPVLRSIRSGTNQRLDVHLMVQEPVQYVKAFSEAGADNLTVHLEACTDIHSTIEKIRECDVKVGVSICPKTDVRELKPLLPKIDMVLIMSVHPGYGGQKFIPESLGRIHAVRQMANELGLQTDIQVDGGIYQANAKEILDAGANIIVAGSAVFKGEPGENTRKFMEILDSYE